MAEYLPLLEEELAYRGEDRRAPGWHKAELAPDVDFNVVIIGAGMSGLLAAHRLQQAGMPFVILEKNDDVGGTWYENTYPGCRVDNPNHNYSYSFAQRHDWPFHFSTQDVLLDYFRDCADAFGLREHIRFGTEVRPATWSDADSDRWTVAYTRTGRDRGDASRPTRSSARSASSTGRRARRSTGRDSFAGPSFHSARWDHDVDLSRQAGRGDRHRRERGAVHPRDRRRRSASSLVFQRTPPWIGPDARLPRRGLRRAAAGCTATCRRTASGTASGSSGGWATACSPRVRVDPDVGARRTRPVSAMQRHRCACCSPSTSRREFADRPDLLEKVVPGVPARREAHAPRQRRVGRRR